MENYKLLDKVESNDRPAQEVAYGLDGVDFNFDIKEVEIINEDGSTRTGYEYKTYRFNSKADYYAWKHEQTESAIIDMIMAK